MAYNLKCWQRLFVPDNVDHFLLDRSDVWT